MCSDHVFGTYNATSLQFREPFWGDVTATIDWCEENYVVSRFLAECWNATSNVVFLLFPLIGVWSSITTKAEARFPLAYLSMVIVGAGSFLFHGTLRYEAQMLDELPMVLMTCLMVFAYVQITHNHRHLGALLAVLGAAETAVYLFTDNVLFFQLCFCGLTLVHVAASLYHAIKLARAGSTPNVARNLTRLLTTEVTMGALAGICWLADNTACDALRGLRENVGYPASVLLQFHAWWHLLTGFSGYTGIVLGQYMRAVALRKRDVTLQWKLGFFPVCVRERRKTPDVATKKLLDVSADASSVLHASDIVSHNTHVVLRSARA